MAFIAMSLTRRDMAHVFRMRSRGLMLRKQASCTWSASSEVSVVYGFAAMQPIFGIREIIGERGAAGVLGCC